MNEKIIKKLNLVLSDKSIGVSKRYGIPVYENERLGIKVAKCDSQGFPLNIPQVTVVHNFTSLRLSESFLVNENKLIDEIYSLICKSTAW